MFMLQLKSVVAYTERKMADILNLRVCDWCRWKYFEHKGELVEKMKGYSAFNIAMTTWAHWIDRKVDPAKTSVFFRSISPVHKK